MQNSPVESEKWEALVVVGGLAGAAVAVELAKAGRHVLLIEKTREPHEKMCGEFISGEALHYLERLGVPLQELGAVPVEGVRLVGHKVIAEVPLSFRAMSLTRRKLDQALLLRASEAGAHVVYGEHVQRIEHQNVVCCSHTNAGRIVQSSSCFWLAESTMCMATGVTPAARVAWLHSKCFFNSLLSSKPL